MFIDVSQVRRQAGVTLVELMIALVILSIIIAFGVPSFRESTANAAIRGTTMDLVAAINTARADAVNLRAVVDMTPATASGWSSGWVLVYPAPHADEGRSFAVATGVQVSETNGLLTLQFRPNGTVDNEAIFTICDGRTGETGRKITLNRLGRMTTEDFPCP